MRALTDWGHGNRLSVANVSAKSESADSVSAAATVSSSSSVTSFSTCPIIGKAISQANRTTRAYLLFNFIIWVLLAVSLSRR